MDQDCHLLVSQKFTALNSLQKYISSTILSQIVLLTSYYLEIFQFVTSILHIDFKLYKL